ncbi:MAG: HAMP domain-containing protein [Candidatus Sericytochromatia bacterium]|nr:HAMP domain-containing protein [Candidatus Tanganyikabacteria bacterium]
MAARRGWRWPRSIATQIWIAFALLMGLMAAVGANGMNALRQLDHEVVELVKKQVRGGASDELYNQVLHARTIYDNAYTAQLAVLLFAFGIGTIVAWAVSRRITRPLGEVTSVVREIAAGDLSRRIEHPETGGEIGELAESVNKMAAEIDRTMGLLEKAYQDLKRTHGHLVQSEKLASLGQLVAGVAHELNNPMTFIYGNTFHLEECLDDLKSLLAAWETSVAEPKEVTQIKKDIDYEYLMIDLAKIIRSCRHGAERAKRIVADLKLFARPEDDQMVGWDLNQGLEAALSLCAGQFKNRVAFVKEYGEIPPVTASPQLTQVFLNLIVNACQAIPEKGEVRLRTWHDGENHFVSVADTGTGIPAEHRDRIFDPFFTTKKVGEGTGLGLSISYGIVEKHGGNIAVESEEGKGTRFIVRLPSRRDVEESEGMGETVASAG